MIRRALILDHDPARLRALEAIIHRILPAHQVSKLSKASTFIETYLQVGHQTELLALGHAILPDPDEDNLGNGELVARLLSGLSPTAPVILHSSDQVAVQRMWKSLKQGGWPVRRVVPSPTWDWIGRDYAYMLDKLRRKGWFAGGLDQTNIRTA